MRRVYPWCVLISCLFCFLLGGLAATAAESSEARVQAALAELRTWMADDRNAEPWNKFLKSDELVAQVQKGRGADRKVVREILERYASETKGLDTSYFVAVRKAVEAWLEDLAQLRPAELPQAARAAREQFVAIQVADVQKAKADLVAALQNLEQFLNSGCRQNAENWKHYLRWTDLQTRLQAEAAPDWRELEQFSDRYYANQGGLELGQFTAVREALDRYSNALAFVTETDSRQCFEKHLEELAQSLESQAKQPNADAAIAIGKHLGWLSKYRQAPELIAAVRKHYWRPNLWVQVSEETMKTAIEMDVEEKVAVNEEILGTTLVGEANMKGQISLDLVPCETHAAIDIILGGTTLTRNVGYNGPVTVYSDGVTKVDARKRVLFDAIGVSSRPSHAQCQTNSTINGIAAHSNLVRNIAWNRAMRMKPEAEQIASERAARQIEVKMDEQAKELLDRVGYMYLEKFRNPLLRRGGFPQLMKATTTEDALHVVGTEAGQDQLAAPNAPPELTGKYDLAVRVHETLVANMGQAFLGGVTLTPERLAEMSENLAGEVPEELEVKEDDEPWSITFAKERPIEARFENQGFTAWVRGTHFTRGDQEVKKPMVISATYKMEKGPHGIKMTRQGDVTVEYSSHVGSQTMQQIAMKRFVKLKFDKLFKEEIVSEGLSLPGNFQSVGKFRLQQMQCAEGWLALGWQQPPRTERTATRKTPIVVD